MDDLPEDDEAAIDGIRPIDHHVIHGSGSNLDFLIRSYSPIPLPVTLDPRRDVQKMRMSQDFSNITTCARSVHSFFFT